MNHSLYSDITLHISMWYWTVFYVFHMGRRNGQDRSQDIMLQGLLFTPKGCTAFPMSFVHKNKETVFIHVKQLSHCWLAASGDIKEQRDIFSVLQTSNLPGTRLHTLILVRFTVGALGVVIMKDLLTFNRSYLPLVGGFNKSSSLLQRQWGDFMFWSFGKRQTLCVCLCDHCHVCS